MKLAFLAAVAILVVTGCARKPEDPDVAGLSQLERSGDKMSAARPIRFYLYLHDEEAARSVAAAIQPLGFTSVVRPAAQGPGTLCLATKSVTPTPENLHAIRKQLTTALREFGGEYDGWESPLVK
jgi:regulator of ribonuclease activity B